MLKELIQVDYPWLEDIWQQFSSQYLDAASPAHIPHAMLITGAAGVGKLALAVRITRGILCRQPSNEGNACGSCKACRMLAGGGHPDLVVLQNAEDSEQIKVDQIRELIHSMHLSAGMSGYRVALLKDAERMNTNAANALLKTLEEPGGRTLLMLCSSHPARLPATVRSRCQQLHVPLPAATLATRYLRSLDDYAAEDIQLALRLAGQAPLAAQQLLGSEELEIARNVQSQLDALALGQQVASDIAADWQERPPGDYWQWVLFWLHQGSSGQLDWPALSRISPRRQQDLYQHALRAWQRSGSGLRHDLQFQEWLLQWQSVAISAGRQ